MIKLVRTEIPFWLMCRKKGTIGTGIASLATLAVGVLLHSGHRK